MLGVAAPSVIQAKTATKGTIYSSTPLAYKAGPSRGRFGEVARTRPAPEPRPNPRTSGGWQNVIAAAPKFGIDLEKKYQQWKPRLANGEWSVRWVIELKARTPVRMQWIFTSGRRWVLWGLFGFMQLRASKNLIYPPATLRFVWQLPEMMQCIGMRLALPARTRLYPAALREFPKFS